MSSYPETRSGARPWTVPHRPMSFTQISDQLSMNDNVVQGSPIEEQPASNSPSGSEPEADTALQRTPSTVEITQRRCLCNLHLKFEMKINEIKVKYFRCRNESRKAWEKEKTTIIDNYNNAPCWALFRFSPRRKIDAINRKQENGMRFFAEAERIERGPVERRFEDREQLYIHCFRRVWKESYPSTPFWYDEASSKSNALGIPVTTLYQPMY
ncbi:hypothetical protein BDP55DRAFT_631153 [Colletotrichum godetiae]|uniref:Uncharacterized protein n=1 Tax=Colletotrichum godetiae TaxID=1209918 RepID=A0AAJ0EUS7_9PEZI|nr:uncharacterized protein BDP55DRAFT_631153 [Colletotrichum godetiae]KAK1676522.1 hypothetical protein BDP55DRAFT_631153 [Colletotrichum godetiae]